MVVDHRVVGNSPELKLAVDNNTLVAVAGSRVLQDMRAWSAGKDWRMVNRLEVGHS